MTRKNGKRLVIDANIAHSAGTCEVPSSRYSRTSLEVVLEGDYVAVFNQSLRQEWKDHSSKYARIWWRSMAAQKRIEDTEGEEFAQHLDRACLCLEHDTWKDALRKDFHLVQSALASGQTIISNEKHFPFFVATVCHTVKELASLYYANPTVEGDICILWIKAGAEKDTARRIDVWAENHQRIDQ
jgi:hypothetical protein